MSPRGTWPTPVRRFVGLWGGPFLAHVYGYELTARGNLLMLPAISHIVGVMVWGQAERIFGAYKPLVLAGALASAGALLLLAAIGRPEPFWLAVWLAVFGFLPAYFPMAAIVEIGETQPQSTTF